jgi:putative ABC transport system substrate-binding protein
MRCPLLTQSGHQRLRIAAVQTDPRAPFRRPQKPDVISVGVGVVLKHWGRAMRRRDFIKVIATAAPLWPLSAHAQQKPVPVIGFIGAESFNLYTDRLNAFRDGLKEIGFVEGQNVAIEYRWAERQYGRYPELAAQLVKLQVAVIAVTGGEHAPQAAEAATKTTPIVFAANGDPVSEGLVASLNRPGGNATGVTIFGGAAIAKRLQLIHEILPQVTRVGYLMNSNNPNNDVEMKAALGPAHSLGAELLVYKAGDEREIDAAFASLAQQQVRALVVASDAYFYYQRNQVISLADRYRVAMVNYLAGFARDGSLLAYGNDLADLYRLVGVYVGRILKGEKPGDLPVVQASKYELVINLKTAKALGLTIPPGVMAIADEVIE